MKICIKNFFCDIIYIENEVGSLIIIILVGNESRLGTPTYPRIRYQK